VSTAKHYRPGQVRHQHRQLQHADWPKKYGTHSVDVDGELARLDADGYRPLRAAATAQAR